MSQASDTARDFLINVATNPDVPAAVRTYIFSKFDELTTKQQQVANAIALARDNTATVAQRQAAINFLIGVAKDG